MNLSDSCDAVEMATPEKAMSLRMTSSGNPELKEALTAWARREVYRTITDDLGSAA